jgi:glycosyltransferase involved in cell wall biosynthesis
LTRVAAVLVTSNSERWLEQTLASVRDQARPADEIVIVDDASSDGTGAVIDRVLGQRARVVASRARSTDKTSRIAANFRQGLQEVRDCGIAVLGDHDDVWHPQRIAHQVEVLDVWRDIELLASDGRLVDVDGAPVPGSLRTAFPVPADFNEMSPALQVRTVIRRSVATGGASAVRPEAFADVEIPPGWLHDRWWSLVAAARGSLRVDVDAVIDYRVSPEQEVGLDRGHQARSAVQRLRTGLASAGSTMSRIRDLQGLSRYATPSTSAEFAGSRLLRTLM